MKVPQYEGDQKKYVKNTTNHIDTIQNCNIQKTNCVMGFLYLKALEAA